MGLDFTIYKKKKNETCQEAWENFRENEIELAYGRKSWELVYALVPNYRDYYESEEYLDGVCNNTDTWEDPIVTKERWDSLIKDMEPIGNKLDDIFDAFSREEHAPVDYPEFVFTDEHKKLIAEYEYWYNKTFNTTPTLGYDFSVGYMKEFWDANDKVQEVFADPELEVRASVSY